MSKKKLILSSSVVLDFRDFLPYDDNNGSFNGEIAAGSKCLQPMRKLTAGHVILTPPF